MNKKLILPLIVIFQVGCTSTSSKNISTQKESSLRTLHNGTFIIGTTPDTPLQNGKIPANFYHDHSGRYANSIGCQSYSELKIVVNANEKAYICTTGGKRVLQRKAVNK